MQYLPSLGWAFMKKIGPSRARAVHSGKSGYDMRALLRESSKQQGSG